MGKLQLKNVMLLSKRSYGIATENISKRTAAIPVIGRAKDVKSSEDLAAGDSEKEFWMRDPKTGNWKPESHYGDIDVAELREKFLPKKDRF